LKLVTVPLTVNVDEPLAPLVKLRPLEEASARVPYDAESVSESAFDPAAASVMEIALLFPLESVKEPFSLREPPPGAEIAGALKAVTVSATLVEADSVSPGSVTETDNESEPE
jgi:hypothetical protein